MMPLRQALGVRNNDVVKTEWCNVDGEIWRVSTHVSGWKEWKLGPMNALILKHYFSFLILATDLFWNKYINTASSHCSPRRSHRFLSHFLWEPIINRNAKEEMVNLMFAGGYP